MIDYMMSEATFRFTVNSNEISELKILSPPFIICNFPWKIVVKKCDEFLGIYLECNEQIQSPNWSCYATVKFRIISHKPDTEPLGKGYFLCHQFCMKDTNWGYREFILWKDCVEPEKGYIKDNTITLEAHVIACNVKPDDPETEKILDQTRSEATLLSKMDSCENLETLSPPIHIFNFPCQIKVTPQKVMAGPQQNQSQHLGLKLDCTKEAVNSDWACSVNLNVQIISDTDKSFCKEIDHLFFGTGEEFIPIIPWEIVLKPEEGYIKNQIITMKIKVTSVHVPIKITGGYKLGKLIIEGKTKQVFDLPDVPGHCMLVNKDRITAGDGVKAHDLEGKAAISNQTNAKVFEILKSTGLKTAYVKMASPTAFVSKKCEMIPIEWVTRRLATGSFLKRNPGVPEGFRFTPPKQETFYKDDANHDPQWSEEQIICANFNFNGLVIGRDEVDYMRKATILVFEILEKAWALRDCALIDMKIEFGVDSEGNILLADVIDSDSWRLWPSGDKRLMVDKQVYRNLSTVTAADLDTVKRNFAWVKDQLDHLKPNVHHKVVVFMGSSADQDHCQKIAKASRELGLDVELRVTSAHKATSETLQIMQQYEDTHGALVFIAVAGRSNGLGPVLSGNTSYPVINCPPPSDKLVQDIWSSLSVPSGLGCATVIYPDSAALMAAQIIGIQDYLVWARLRVKQLEMATTLRQADKKIKNLKS